VLITGEGHFTFTPPHSEEGTSNLNPPSVPHMLL
jgi:hypothetical protein